MICDFLIIGGGVIGINIARTLKKRFPELKIILIEKEKNLGEHASGRNSGVLHAGFYYTANSLKAKFTRIGNEKLTKYCDEKKIKINKCGKLVVAKNKDELPFLEELLNRGKINGVRLKEISESEAKKIEPRVKTYKKAIFSPDTSSVNPLDVVNSMREDALKEGVEIKTNTIYLRREKNKIFTNNETIEAKYIINAAGLYADKIALDFGFSEKYRILPFKGLYLYSEEKIGSLKTNIYPVPDLRNPFLGVHFTITADGHIKIGPTAIPAFWREQYGFFERFKLDEFFDVIFRESQLFLNSNFNFKKLAIEEIQKYSRKKMVRLASELCENVYEENYLKWGRSGIRAQLLDIKEKKLEMDFIIEGDEKSLHVLNAVSPGFTCSIPFSEYVCDEVERLTK